MPLHHTHSSGSPVPPEGVLQEPCQLRVPVGHVPASLGLVAQGTDDVAEGKLRTYSIREHEPVEELRLH